MGTGKRSALIRWLTALGLLLTATAIAAVEYNAYSSDVVQILISDAYYLLLLATWLVVASAIVAIGAVGEMSRNLSGDMRPTRARSLDALICLLAAGLLPFGWSPFELDTLCPSNPYNWVEYDSLAHGYYATYICIGRGVPTRNFVALLATLFLILCAIFIIGAAFAGLTSAYTTSRWAWFVAILVLAIGSVGDGVAWLKSPLRPEPIFLATPLLTLGVVLAYSFVGGKRVKMTT